MHERSQDNDRRKKVVDHTEITDLRKRYFQLRRELHSLHQEFHFFKEQVMANEAEIVSKLRDANTRLTKIEGEVSGVQDEVTALKVEVVRLNEIIAAGGGVGGEVTQELVDEVAKIEAGLDRVDNKIPDVSQP